MGRKKGRGENGRRKWTSGGWGSGSKGPCEAVWLVADRTGGSEEGASAKPNGKGLRRPRSDIGTLSRRA